MEVKRILFFVLFLGRCFRERIVEFFLGAGWYVFIVLEFFYFLSFIFDLGFFRVKVVSFRYRYFI